MAEPPASPSWTAPSDSALYRLALLPAQVQIALAAGDLATARAAADELTTRVETFHTVASRASSAVARGTVALAEGDVAAAGNDLRQALQWWTELDAPHEAAVARFHLGRALAAGSRR